MSDLSPYARSLLDGAHGAYEPLPRDAARVRAALAVAAPGVASAAATVAKVQAASVLKLSAFVASVVVGSLGVVEGAALLRKPVSTSPPARVAVVKRAAGGVARPVPVEAPAPAPVMQVDVMEIAVSATPAPHVPVALATPKTSSAPAVALAPAASTPPAAPLSLNGACDAAAELALLQRLQRWLSSAPLEALRQLDDFEETCPEGTLIEERLATRAIALCSAGRPSDGRAQLGLLEARNKSSPALTRVRQACAAAP